ncbi:hypothetical protein BKA82DRAFT_991253 [Pisolithus tinctorius]|uniref:F-box domain-containing protein n=1 Tax=Pisolithus tinctorius Marx 270 TaxID=870435 RepID=A0A0C3PYX6_PISTI|nr:hypothetical protein BKA82DRAFT_991253 [Pisolithus tinctorius]KIO14499.1 hypothetical protein M404DRAFT_991253 [Pisolithus tinctorius Marx 270]
MDDLAEARAELTLLEEQERQLFERLRNVRTAVQVQRNRIDQLLKHVTKPSINRLPITVLYQIIHLADDEYGLLDGAPLRAKRRLASVSRRWRDVILTSPGFWTTIAICPSWSPSLMRVYVKRSRECPLNIQIRWWLSRDQLPKFFELLGLVISCGYRWRSLIIQNNNKDVEQGIIKSVWNVMFPSLKHVSIYVTQKLDYPPFLHSQNAHVLEHLDLGNNIGLDNFSVAASLKSLRLRCSPLTAPLPSITSLRMLTMTGSSCGALHPDSIHLPLLESLTVMLEDPQSFLAAIVAPNLGYFSYSPLQLTTRWSGIFTDLSDKFPNVQHLCLRHPRSSLNGADIGDAAAVCAAFPGVHHIEVNVPAFQAFCLAEQEGGTLSIADRWTHLEHLSLEMVDHNHPGVRFVEWLRARRHEGRPALQVTLSKFDAACVPNGRWLISLYNSLHEYCLLELKNVPLMFNLTVRTSDPTSLHDVYGILRPWVSLDGQ